MRMNLKAKSADELREIEFRRELIHVFVVQGHYGENAIKRAEPLVRYIIDGTIPSKVDAVRPV
jgi:hypothetical protein